MKHNWLPKTNVPGVTFPAIPDGQAALLLSIQFQLSQSQWWSADQLLNAQLKQLTPLVHHAKDSTRHYRHLEIARDTVLTEEIFRSFPLLGRRDVQMAGEDLFSDSVPQLHGPATPVMTSGSTGQPVTVLKTALLSLFWKAFTLRESIWHKRDLSAHLGIIRSISDPDVGQSPDGTDLTGWGPSTDDIFPSAPATLLNVGTPIDEQAEWLQKTDPHYLLTYPSNLHALADYFRSNSLTPPSSLVQLRTLGELLSEDTREICREVFGVGIADIYSNQEAGYLALQCPDGDNYHVQAENVLVEVLDDAGKPCVAGEIGKIVITDLHNYASPLLRYVVGDYAEVGTLCQCGRGLPTLRRIIGRERNMWVRPDGRRAWPNITSKIMGKAAPYRQLQLEQRSIDLIIVRLVPDGTFNSHHQAALTSAIHKCLEYPVPLKFEVVDSIKRGANGKFEEFICRIEHDQL
jgi:phenylacetate-coenzyme A ligase PaaK-like adenylate-forming protein